MTKRILIECTPTYSTNLLTGIQRVVRSIVSASQSLKTAEVIPVIWVNQQLYAIQYCDGPNQQARSTGIVSRLLKVKFFIRLKDGLRRFTAPLFSWLKQRYMSSRSSILLSEKAVPLDLQDYDVLIMLDSSWGRKDLIDLHQFALNKDVAVVYVLYDLIPVVNTQFCSALHTKEFDEFIANNLMKADCVIGISGSVISDFKSYVRKYYPEQALPKLDYFHLGVDKQRFANGEVRESLKAVFKDQQPVFLMVSTIEPRKNHAYLLNCFDQLWREGVEVNLLFVGKVGWEVASLMKRINQHPQRNQRFFVMHDATDAELTYTYKHSTTLLFLSHAEGFGLPIIEALEHGLPVILSDIPVHREVGGDLAMYIETAQTNALVDLVKAILVEGVPLKHQPHDYNGLSWEQSAQQLVDRVLLMSKPL